MAISVALRKQARAWCRNKWGLQWHEDGASKGRMAEAYAALMARPTPEPAMPVPLPDLLLVRELDAGFYVNFGEEEEPEWATACDGQIGGYHAIALPTPDDLWADELTVRPNDAADTSGRRYTEADLTHDWDILQQARCSADLDRLTRVEWGQHTPEDEQEGVITVYGPFPALTQYVAFLQHSYDSNSGYTAHWLDEVPAGTKPGDDVLLKDGRRARLMDDWLLEHVRPRMNVSLEYRGEPPAGTA